MKMNQICFLMPEWVTVATVEQFSPSLWKVLEKYVSVASFFTHVVPWDGTLTALYAHSGCFVFVSTHFRSNLSELASVCCEQGHIPFHDDESLVLGGAFTQSDGRDIVIAARHLLDRVLK